MRHEDSAGRSPRDHPARHLPTHRQTDKDLHERRPRQTTHLRNGHTHSRENETLKNIHTKFLYVVKNAGYTIQSSQN